MLLAHAHLALPGYRVYRGADSLQRQVDAKKQELALQGHELYQGQQLFEGLKKGAAYVVVRVLSLRVVVAESNEG